MKLLPQVYDPIMKWTGELEKNFRDLALQEDDLKDFLARFM